MDGIVSVAALAIVATAALYLLVLGGGAIVRPETARRFLGGFATTQSRHVSELALRILTGSALVLSAPRMAFGTAILIFGWILVATSLILALVPWRHHQRFAAWSVPQAARHMPLIGVAALAAGFGLIAAILMSHSVG